MQAWCGGGYTPWQDAQKAIECDTQDAQRRSQSVPITSDRQKPFSSLASTYQKSFCARHTGCWKTRLA